MRRGLSGTDAVGVASGRRAVREARHGPRLLSDGGVEFRLWAPAAKRVDLVIDSRRAPMKADADGWFSRTESQAGAGTRYQFRIDDEIDVPDPAAAFQPDDVNGPSEVIDHRYPWRTESWRGRPWQECVFLELHVGTFSAEGTYRGVIDHLDHLVETGITAIELMPLSDFPGRRNWGYDGVLPYAPDSVYGRPEDLKALIDAAHERGLMIFLDVVYNHFGPEGNYLPRYAPAFFTRDRMTPWGGAIDYRVPEVRAFAVDNALHWLDDYRFDGLRLDAVHAITEVGDPPILEEMSRAVDRLARETGRHIHLVLENDDNAARLLDPGGDPGAGRYRAQWNDDYHHAWHVLLTGEKAGYYGDYADAPRRHLLRCLSSGFAYQGEPSPHRGSLPRGEDSTNLPPVAFVNFLQNHDQIGNRPFGDRLETLAPAPAIEAALAITLLLPMPPMLYMGEEWGAEQPFPFFCDFTGDLAKAVEEGRKREFQDIFARLPPGRTLPNPMQIETFNMAKLDWGDLRQPKHRARLDLVRRLLTIRRQQIVPRLTGIAGRQEAARDDGDGAVVASWRLGDGSRLHLLANLGDRPARLPATRRSGMPIWGTPPAADLEPWSVFWQIGQD